jgi:DNA-binding NtrC family response regulator
VLRRIIVLGEREGNLDKIINTPQNSGHNNIESNFRIGFGLNGHRIDLADFSLKKFRKQVSDQVEKRTISYVLEKTAWNRSKACEILKVSYKTLLSRIQDLGLKPPEGFV